MEYNQKGFTTKRRCLSSHKLGFCLIALGLVWGFYLLRLTAVYELKQQKESEVLKSRIIDLSKKYIAAMSKEQTLEHIDMVGPGRSKTRESLT